ncbi:hypothetical protein MNBD_IGNAVI01-719 [hydrothermal vent metagenome]|uniref:Yip1 domain-containing protein n=1 Tax=hydrothermal vent metagenome TaxID=652676 RepID=A0A3B1C4G3_9ZZZZ
MKNTITCQNCKSENDFYRLNCISCGALLRNRVVNLDLWSTLWQVIETPTQAFKNIVFAENKNYTFFIAILFSIKLTFNSFFVKSNLGKGIDFQNYLGMDLLIGIVTFIVVFLLAAIVQKLTLKRFGVHTRFKDNFAVFIYASVPILISFIIFFPVEYALFGKYWLFFNPSPYMIKPTAAYVFTWMEVLMVVWMYILFILAGFVQSRSKVFAFASATSLILILAAISIFIPYL